MEKPRKPCKYCSAGKFLRCSEVETWQASDGMRVALPHSCGIDLLNLQIPVLIWFTIHRASRATMRA